MKGIERRTLEVKKEAEQKRNRTVRTLEVKKEAKQKEAKGARWR